MQTLPSRIDKQLPAKQDVLDMLLSDKRGENTRRAYRADLVDFFGHEPTPQDVQAFLSLNTGQMAFTLNEYKARLIQEGKREATVNRRLAAVKFLINKGRQLGQCTVDPKGLVDSEKVKAYRDTSGVDKDLMRKLLSAPDTNTLKGKRDRAILLLLWENALRRAEVCKLDISDFWPNERKLTILGKGRGTQKESMQLSERTTNAILEYLDADGRANAVDGPLFLSCHNSGGYRLTTNGLYYLVSYYAKQVGINKRFSPHRIRHSSITALIVAGARLEDVQSLSRHSKIETLMRYYDNIGQAQGDMTNMLAALA